MKRKRSAVVDMGPLGGLRIHRMRWRVSSLHLLRPALERFSVSFDAPCPAMTPLRKFRSARKVPPKKGKAAPARNRQEARRWVVHLHGFRFTGA